MTALLLVEDDVLIAKNLTLLLRAEGFTITHAASNQQALSLFEPQKFDLALIDIALPDGNGFTLCTEIKALEDIPVIFLTASGEESSVVTGLSIGADD